MKKTILLLLISGLLSSCLNLKTMASLDVGANTGSANPMNTFQFGMGFPIATISDSFLASSYFDFDIVDSNTIQNGFSGNFNLELDYYLNGVDRTGFYVGSIINTIQAFDTNPDSDITNNVEVYGFKPNKLILGYGLESSPAEFFIEYKFTKGLAEHKYNKVLGNYIGVGCRLNFTDW